LLFRRQSTRTARRLHRLGGAALFTDPTLAQPLADQGLLHRLSPETLVDDDVLLTAARDGLRDGHWISDVPHVLAQRGRLPRGRGGGRRTTVGVRVVRQPRHPLRPHGGLDRKIADLLTSKKNSPVIYVPQLAEVPPAATSEVYIFSNGIQPEHRGPLGFQGDVFPTAPGDAQYSPLRSLELVTWKNPRSARELTAAADVLAAQKAGELSLTSPGIVINMPFLAWPSGHR